MATRGAIKGITIEIGGDTTQLQSALKDVDKQLKTTQSNLKDINKLLKLDPGNTELLVQKQKNLKSAIDGTKKKLETLKSVQKDSVSPEEWDALQREIIETEGNLKDLEKEYKSFGSVGAQKLKVVGNNVSKVGKKITSFGESMTTHVTAPIMALGAAAYAGFTEVDEGMDTLITKTGATGEALDDMGDIMKRIATNVPTDFATAGEAVGEVNTRFGVTGQTLEDLSAQFIKFASLNGTDVTSAVDSAQKAMTAYGLSVDDASGYLDYLTLISQQTGADVNTLMSSVQSNSAAFKEMGLSIYDATALMGQLEVSGADSSTVMSGLQKALKNAAQEGKPLDVALAELQSTILNGTGTTDGLTAAYDLFGKSGAQIFELVKSGAIDFTTLAGSAELAAGTVSDTFESTLDPADNFTMAMNALKETGASIAETVMPILAEALDKVKNVILTLKEKWDNLDEGQKQTILTIAGIVAAVGPVLAIIGKVVSGVGSIISIVGSLFGAVGGILPGGLIIVGLVAAGMLIKDHWDEIKTWVTDTLIPKIKEAWENLQPKIEEVFNAIKGFWEDTLKPALSNMWAFITGTVVPLIQKAWQDFQPKIQAVFEALTGFWNDTLKPALQNMWIFITGTLVPMIQTAWQNLQPKIQAVFEALSGFWNDTLKPALQNMWIFITGTLIPFIQTAWQNLQPKIQAVFETLTSLWNDTLKPALQNMWVFITATLIPFVQTAWQNLQPKVQAVFEALSSFWNDTLKPAFEDMKTFVVDTLWPKLRDAFIFIKNKASEVFTKIKTFWEETLKPTFEAIKTFVVDTLWPKFRDMFMNIRNKVSTVFTAIKGFWDNTLQPVFQAIWNFINDTLGPIFTTTFDTIKTTVDNSLGAISTLWNDTVKPVYDGIVTFFTGAFKGDWSTAMDGIKTIGEGVWSGLTTTVNTFTTNCLLWGKNILKNIKTGMEGVWESIVKPAIDGIWNALPEGIQTAVTSALDWGSGIVTNIKDGLVNGWNTVKTSIGNIWSWITGGITGKGESGDSTSMMDAASTWGSDMINNFVDGVKQKWEEVKEGVLGVAQKIKDWLGFSQPEEGPLSDFDTYGPDMMQLFADGVRTSMYLLTNEIETLGGNVKLQFQQLGKDSQKQFDIGLNGMWGNKLTKIVQGSFEAAYNGVAGMDWYGLGRKIYEKVTYYCSWIQGQFKGAFDFSRIHVKTPHFEVHRWDNISGAYYPQMRVRWYKKAYDNPIMFTKPTVLGTAGGYKGFGDGAGAEIVLSADKLREIAGAGGDTTINVYAQPGQDAQQIAEEVQLILARQQRQRRSAYA